jgi:tetratricopeptide (TPR) repeat protein
MKLKLFFLSVVLYFVSCSQTKINYVAKVKLHTLSGSDIFNKEKVYDVIFDAEELQVDSLKNQSRHLFLNGIDAYKNKKHLPEAIDYFKRSLLVFPEAKTYYELGNALLDYNQGEGTLIMVDSAYQVAEYLDFQPKSMLYFKKACVDNLMKDNDWSALNNLRQAFENGFKDTNLIKTDNRISDIISSIEYQDLIIELNAGKFKNNVGGLFGLFAQSFQSVQQPFEITLDNVELKGYSKSISYDFSRFIPEMQNTSFGRDVSNDYFFVAKVIETETYSALVYKSVSFVGEEMQPVIAKLMTYDKEGNIIASKIFAAQFSAEKIKTGKIENNILYLEDYKRIWKQPIDKVPFEENEVEKYESIAKAEFIIDNNGKIIEKSVPANYNDSSSIVKK